MRNQHRQEVDCADCVSGQRCWPEGAAPGDGFLVRRIRLLEAGESLYRAGSRFEAPYIVTSGCLSVSELLEDGQERIVGFRVPGELVGLESWNHPVYRYGAQAVTASTLCRLRWSTSPGAVRGAALLRALMSKMTAQTLPSAMPWPGLAATERVRAFIEDFRRRTDQPLPMTRAQIGSYLGMAEETVVRAFKTLRLRGVTRAAPD
jgi:CRP/FNR family transcriptional regulator